MNPPLELGPIQGELLSLLREVPSILSREQPEEVDRRLFPPPSADDEELNREWRRMVDPDLRALLASARELVEEDLAAMRPVEGRRGGGGLWLRIPANHLQAWISALNAARLALGASFDLTQDEVDRPIDEIRTPMDRALWKIHVLGWIQEHLIEEVQS